MPKVVLSEQRQEFEQTLEKLVKITSPDVKSINIEWNDGESADNELSARFVNIEFTNGHSKKVNVTFNSPKVIVYDVFHKIVW